MYQRFRDLEKTEKHCFRGWTKGHIKYNAFGNIEINLKVRFKDTFFLIHFTAQSHEIQLF
jgi:hypothetical protein